MMYLVSHAEIISKYGNPEETIPVVVCKKEEDAKKMVEDENTKILKASPDADERFYYSPISEFKEKE